MRHHNQPGVCVDCGRPTSRALAQRCMACARDHRRNGARKEALETLERQLDAGTLVIRQMTAEEREFWGPPRKMTRRAFKAKRARNLATPGASGFEDYDEEDDE